MAITIHHTQKKKVCAAMETLFQVVAEQHLVRLNQGESQEEALGWKNHQYRVLGHLAVELRIGPWANGLADTAGGED